MRTFLRALAALTLLVVACFGTLAVARAEDRPLLVFAAASLKNALDAAAGDFTRGSGTAVTVSYAASPALAKQVEAGAPADVFISADLAWMDYLAERGAIRAHTRRNLLGNSLVLVAPAEAPIELTIAPGFPLATALGSGRLAMANTDAVPGGKYGKAALETLGVWSQVADRLAQAENVRAALALISRRETPLGIVYRTDAAADQNVVIVDTPAWTHPRIVYPAAVVVPSTHPRAEAFLVFLASDEAGRRFRDDAN